MYAPTSFIVRPCNCDAICAQVASSNPEIMGTGTSSVGLHVDAPEQGDGAAGRVPRGDHRTGPERHELLDADVLGDLRVAVDERDELIVHHRHVVQEAGDVQAGHRAGGRHPYPVAPPTVGELLEQTG